MSESARAVLVAAARLSEEERAEVVEELELTLRSNEDEQAWHAELVRRRLEVEQGLSRPIPWEVVRADGEKLLHGHD